MRFVFLMLLLGLSAFCTQPDESFCYEEAGNSYGISPHLLHAISKGESNFYPLSVNHNTNGSYDFVLMQINSSPFDSKKDVSVIHIYFIDPAQIIVIVPRQTRQKWDRVYRLATHGHPQAHDAGHEWRKCQAPIDSAGAIHSKGFTGLTAYPVVVMSCTIRSTICFSPRNS